MTHRLLKNWFEDKGWRPFPFQKECWKAYLEGKSGLVHAPTGVGKTYAVLGGPLLEFAQLNHKKVEPLRVLWITPLRALANDTLKSILQPIEELGLNLTAELRHGDVSSHIRKKQLFKLPSLLIITPESLSLLFTYPETRQRFSSLAAVIVDEWHEMLGNKRGVQTELALGRLKKWSPKLKIWGVSATLSNLPESMNVLLGDRARDACIVEGKLDKKVEVQTLMPKDIETFPWAGHLGIRLVDQVIEHIARVKTSILFTNTRAQTELWFEAILKTRPQWKDQIALHHGSIDRDIRKSVELKLKQEQLKVVVSTSSLDLGVDFSPVEKVFQVGSPKGIARLIQRAGRSGHQPGKPSCIIGVPTNALELIEFAAARDARKQNEIEARAPTIKPLDVLIQHIVTVAAEGKTQIQDLKDEILSSNAYKDLTEDEWEWALNFVTQGGKALSAYPQYTKVVIEPNNVLTVPSKQTVHFHRMSIGTITADSQVLVKFLQGRLLGSVEESFITRIKPGDIFQFAGKRLKLIRFKDLTAYVRLAKSSKNTRPVGREDELHSPPS
ncbi:MAG: DEAD/DEAH box helicase [Verrucomicrobiota bacterium]